MNFDLFVERKSWTVYLSLWEWSAFAITSRSLMSAFDLYEGGAQGRSFATDVGENQVSSKGIDVSLSCTWSHNGTGQRVWLTGIYGCTKRCFVSFSMLPEECSVSITVDRARSIRMSACSRGPTIIDVCIYSIIHALIDPASITFQCIRVNDRVSGSWFSRVEVIVESNAVLIAVTTKTELIKYRILKTRREGRYSRDLFISTWCFNSGIRLMGMPSHFQSLIKDNKSYYFRRQV